MVKVNKIEEILRDDYDRLTPSQRRLADYIFQNPYDVALMSSADVALRLDISEATVVRFAQALGFEGYPALRDSLRQQLIREVRSSERVATMLYEPRDQAGTLHEIVSQNIFHLNRLLENVTEEDLKEVIKRLDGANRIFIFGEGAPGSLVLHMDFWLSRLGYEVRAITQTGRRFYDRIFHAAEGDVALLLAFRRPTSEALALLEVMQECGGHSILITDLVHSKMHGLATHTLRVQRGPMDAFRPLGPISAILDAIILGLMRLKGEEGIAKLRYLDDIRQRYGVLYDE